MKMKNVLCRELNAVRYENVPFKEHNQFYTRCMRLLLNSHGRYRWVESKLKRGDMRLVFISLNEHKTNELGRLQVNSTPLQNDPAHDIIVL